MGVRTVTTVSGMLNVDAMNFVGCSECGQEAGKSCRTRKNQRMIVPHDERVAAFREQFPQFAHLYRGGQMDAVAVRKANEKWIKEQG